MTGFTLHDNDGNVVGLDEHIDEALRIARRRIDRGLPYEYIARASDGAICAVRPNQKKRGARYTAFVVSAVSDVAEMAR